MQRRFIVTSIIYTASILILAVLIWLFFFAVPPEARLIEYVPETADVFFESGETTWDDDLLSNWFGPQQLQNFRDITSRMLPDRLMYAFDRDTELEYYILHFQRKISDEEYEQMTTQLSSFGAELENGQWFFFRPKHDVVVMSTDQSYSDLLPQRYITFQEWPQDGIRLAATVLPDTFSIFGDISQTSADLAYLVHYLSGPDVPRLSWSWRSTVAFTAPPLYIPHDFDTLVVVSRSEFDDILQAETGLLAEVATAIHKAMNAKYNHDLDDFFEEVGTYVLFAEAGGQWLVQTDTTSLVTMGEQISNYLLPQLRVGLLPDGSVYRELVRQRNEPTSTEIEGTTMYYWGEIEENRIYALEFDGTSVLTNDLNLLRGAVTIEPSLPAEIADCLADSTDKIRDLVVIRETSVHFPVRGPLTILHTQGNLRETITLCR